MEGGFGLAIFSDEIAQFRYALQRQGELLLEKLHPPQLQGSLLPLLTKSRIGNFSETKKKGNEG